MTSPFYVVATLQPAPGKTQEVLATLKSFTEYVKATVPGCLQLEIFRPVDAEDGSDTPIFFIELWDNMEALEALRKTEEYKALYAKVESDSLLSAVPEFKALKSVLGFGPR
ncbi:hypothetical protein H2200_002234 [Cladophialophora chaetospira]|uniref:ABM domain-containing protein n=1 Tax=Cladophialophora chaetospira TaxID=386627 RepID=A0AA38XIP6_9EURO|nr:hypothetical protein H2200_002234 [Cladophialophora chaetospira]